MSDLNEELVAAHRIALEAAELVRGYHGSTIKVDRKLHDEPVTEADRKASELIMARLKEAFPDDAILSEESPDDGSRFNKPRASHHIINLPEKRNWKKRAAHRAVVPLLISLAHSLGSPCSNKTGRRKSHI